MTTPRREPALYQIEHTTRFEYAEPVRETFMTVFLKPKGSATQHLEAFAITTTPGAELSSYEDSFGNTAHFFDVPGRHDRLTVTAESVVAVHPSRDAARADGGSAGEPAGSEPAWKDLENADGPRLWHFLNPTDLTRPTPMLADFLRREGIERQDTPLASIRELTRRIPEALTFRAGRTHVDSPIDDALTAKTGVCQDFAHLMLAIVREWGIPARYISGYVFPYPGDSAASHAWVECLLPGRGWVEADPANATHPGAQHIRLAAGRDYRDVPPTRGHFLAATREDLSVKVRISALEAAGWNPDGAASPPPPNGLAAEPTNGAPEGDAGAGAGGESDAGAGDGSSGGPGGESGR